jgi:hypothetical protein
MNDKELIKGLLERTQRASEAIGKNLEPDEDWETTAVIATIDSERGIGIGILPLLFTNDEEKDQAFNQTLPSAVAQTGARAIVLVLPSWTIEGPDYDPSGPSPSQHPKRKEILLLTGTTLEYNETRRAEVIRSENGPPTLGPWETISTTEDIDQVKLSGTIVSAVLAALSQAAGSRN